MNSLGILLMLVTVGLLFTLPRRWAALGLFMAAYVPATQQIQVDLFHFSVVRILIAAGFARVLLKGERIAGGLNLLDWMVILWAVWAVWSSAFHEAGALVNRLGLVYDCCGIYFLFRIFVQNAEDIARNFKIVCILFVPLAVAMILEKTTGENS